MGKANNQSVHQDACLRIRVLMAKFAGSAYSPAALKPPSSTMCVWVLLAALVGYAAVSWCVLTLVTAVIGDPLANYLLSTHSNAVYTAHRTIRSSPPISTCQAAKAVTVSGFNLKLLSGDSALQKVFYTADSSLRSLHLNLPSDATVNVF